MVPVLDELVEAYPGKVQLIVKDFPLAIHSGSELAHEASLAAKAQGKYWEMYRLLYANQKQLQKADLLRYAKSLNLDMEKFQRALDAHQYRRAIRESIAEGNALGVEATPTFFFQGQKLSGFQSFQSLQTQLDAVLKGEPSSGTEPNSQTEEMAASGLPVRGSPDAPVTIVEYADFQCPFCARAEGALDQVLREYPGKVKLVFKNFPLDFHADAMLAHRAAVAAGEHGQFWQMHDLIFSHQSSIKRDDLLAMAKSLGLDSARFEQDLDSDVLKREIDADLADGRRRGVNGTPTFYVNGKEMVGQSTAPQFEALIDEELRAKGIEPVHAPVVADGGPSRGPEHAPVTVVWYSDVTSPLAANASSLVDQILALYPGDVRVVFKNRPLEFRHDAEMAHEALMAAGAQGKFWAMHRVLLTHQNALSAQDLLNYAANIGLDSQRFYSDLTTGAERDEVQKDVAQARLSGINGVPVFLVNGKRVDGVQTLSKFKAIVEEELQRARVAAVR